MSIRDDILTVRSSRGLVSGKLMFAIVSFGFSLILFFAFVVPEYENIQQLMAEGRAKSKNIEAKNDTLKNILDFKKSIENVSNSDLEKVKVFIPGDNKVEFQLSNIDSLRRIYRLTLTGISVNEAGSAKGSKKEDSLILQGKEVKKSLLNFTVGGDFSGILSFIYSLERNIPFTNMESLEIVTDKKEVENKETGETEEIKTIEANVSLTLYHY